MQNTEALSGYVIILEWPVLSSTLGAVLPLTLWAVLLILCVLGTKSVNEEREEQDMNCVMTMQVGYSDWCTAPHLLGKIVRPFVIIFLVDCFMTTVVRLAQLPTGN